MNVVQILTEARALLVGVGRAKRAFHSDGSYCSLGAVNAAAGVRQDWYTPRRDGSPVQRAAWFLANAITGETASMLPSLATAAFNDDHDDTTVLRLFDRAISNARRRHPSKTPFKVVVP